MKKGLVPFQAPALMPWAQAAIMDGDLLCGIKLPAWP